MNNLQEFIYRMLAPEIKIMLEICTGVTKATRECSRNDCYLQTGEDPSIEIFQADQYCYIALAGSGSVYGYCSKDCGKGIYKDSEFYQLSEIFQHRDLITSLFALTQ